MEELEMMCFEIISSVGTARSMYIEAIQEAKKKNFVEAENLMKEGSEVFLTGHHAHSKLIQNEASGNPTKISLILLHAEDQLMSAEGFKIIANEFIELYKSLG